MYGKKKKEQTQNNIGKNVFTDKKANGEFEKTNCKK